MMVREHVHEVSTRLVQIRVLLHVELPLRIGAEVAVRQAQNCISTDAALLVREFVEAVRRDVNRSRQGIARVAWGWHVCIVAVCVNWLGGCGMRCAAKSVDPMNQGGRDAARRLDAKAGCLANFAVMLETRLAQEAAPRRLLPLGS